ncbi:TetR/AcrR family transcriptional regulator [Saxibacter everestensis]|uniref:TetR/AcrR family transcriptional regulator n=1 Tax=Saxibacter everestensis TaxID=2909229 RepID=A0ABY8QQ99_9MICO|nr:TetR/AcrR family transcriptional regulator [Brevibacteriaceae bacterium ZFBP1038]
MPSIPQSEDPVAEPQAAETQVAARPQKARRGRPGYDYATVLRIAIDVFNRRGYDGTSMDDLAKELGLSKSAIYHHVHGKEELLRLALSEGLDALTSVLEEEERRTDDASALERLRHVVVRSAEVLSAHQPSVTLLLRVRGNSEVELDAMRRRREIDHRMARLVSLAVDDGSVRSDIDPTMISRLLFGMVNSLTEWYRPDRGYDSKVVAEAVASLAFDGLRA